jgi:hypothetical protein
MEGTLWYWFHVFHHWWKCSSLLWRHPTIGTDSFDVVQIPDNLSRFAQLIRMRPAHLPLMATLLFEGSVFSADSQENSRLRETVHTHLLARLFDPRPGDLSK